MDSLLDLGNDILYLVAEELEHLNDKRRSLLAVGATCRHLRSLLSPLLYRRVAQVDGEDVVRELRGLVLSASTNKHVSYYKGRVGEKNFQRFLHVLNTSEAYRRHVREANIEKRELSIAHSEEVATSLTRLENLQALRVCCIIGEDEPPDGDEDEQAQARFSDGVSHPQITSLSLNTCVKCDVAKVFPNLQLLNLEDRGLWCDYTASMGGLERLKHLEFGDVWFWPFHVQPQDIIPQQAETLRNLATGLPNLQYIGTFRARGYANLAPALAKFRNLRAVSIRIRYELEDHFQTSDYCCDECHGPIICASRWERLGLSVARTMFQASQSLEVLWLGKVHESAASNAEPTRDLGAVACQRDSDGGLRDVMYRPEMRRKKAIDFFPVCDD